MVQKTKKTKDVLGVDVDYSPERKMTYVKKAYEDGKSIEKGRDEKRPKVSTEDNQLDKPALFAKANFARVQESMCDHIDYDHSVERGPTAAELMRDQHEANFKQHLSELYSRDTLGAA